MLLFDQDEDVHRTAGVDTVYLETTSFEMDGKDKLFLVQVSKAKKKVFRKPQLSFKYNIKKEV